MLQVLFLISSISMSVQHEWTWSVHPESGFKVLSPFELVHQVTEIPTIAEPIVYHQYHGGSLQDSILQLAFVIDHYKISRQEIGGDEEHLREFFGITVDEILKAVNGTLVYIDYTTQADREICLWRASYENGKGIIRGQLIVEGDKYYGLQAFGYDLERTNVMMRKFIDSFHITDTE
ncbi:MAG TPA: hypothetical protein VMZ69_00450 [Saprospiraceae bacterium]|nr:hypothetical protein [Saprospiraceae bacterium]